MALILRCTVNEAPCPPEHQAWVTVEDVLSPADLGVTSAAVLEVMGWGFGFVILMWSLGYAVAAALRVIRKV